MQLCYVDESGDEQPLVGREAPPVLVIAGLVVAEVTRKALIWDYLQIKKRFEPQRLTPSSQLSEVITHEIRGSDLRADLRKGRRRMVRRAIGILDSVVAVMEVHHATLVGYVHVKKDGVGPRAGVYPDAIAKIAEQFEAQLRAADTTGMMILDARTKVKNVPSVQTITTRQFRSGGDTLPHLSESPVFGHSDTHVVLQAADLVASALLFPMACAAYWGMWRATRIPTQATINSEPASVSVYDVWSTGTWMPTATAEAASSCSIHGTSGQRWSCSRHRRAPDPPLRAVRVTP